MAGALFVKGRHIARAVDQAAHGVVALGPFTGHSPPLVVVGLFAQRLGLGPGLGHVGVAAHPVAIDGVFPDPLVHQLHRLDRHVPGALGVGRAELRLEGFLPARVAHDHLTAVTPAGARPDAVGLQHHHRQPPLRHLQGRTQARKTGAHDHHVGVHRAVQGWLVGTARGAGFVIAFLVELGIGMDERGGHGRYFQQRQQRQQ